MYKKWMPLAQLTVGQAVREIATYNRIIHQYRQGDNAGVEMGLTHFVVDRRMLLDELSGMGFCPDLGCTHCYPGKCLACGLGEER